MATLSSNATIRLSWAWEDEVGLGSVIDSGVVRDSTIISDAAITNLVWQDSRSAPAGMVDAIDLESLPITTLGVSGVVKFNRIHKIFIANNSTADASIRVGVPQGSPATTYAMEVSQQSYSLQYSNEGWSPADLLRIANPGATAVPYDIVLIGEGEVVSA